MIDSFPQTTAPNPAPPPAKVEPPGPDPHLERWAREVAGVAAISVLDRVPRDVPGRVPRRGGRGLGAARSPAAGQRPHDPGEGIAGGGRAVESRTRPTGLTPVTSTDV